MPYAPNLLNIPSNVGSVLDSVRMSTGGAQQAVQNYMPDILAQINSLKSANPAPTSGENPRQWWQTPSLLSGVGRAPKEGDVYGNMIFQNGQWVPKMPTMPGATAQPMATGTTNQQPQQGVYYSPGKGGGRIMYRPETGSSGMPWFNLLQNPALMEMVELLRKAQANEH